MNIFRKSTTLAAVKLTPPAQKERPKASEPQGRVSPEEAFDACIDAIGCLLKAYGQSVFDLDGEASEESRVTFEEWEKHILVGAKPPAGSQGAEGRRDWRGVQNFFRGYRTREVAYVNKSIEGLRGVVWMFVRSLSTAMSADEKGDDTVRSQLQRLQTSIDAKDPLKLMSDATEAVSVIGKMMEERSERQRVQLVSLAAEVRKLGSKLEEAKREGELDSLTKLYNRACFDQYLDRTASLAIFGTPASLMMIDIDHFKKVNDTYGHPAGDSVIKAVSDALIRAFPRRGDLVARYGGEEFAVILRDAKKEDARLLAERILVAVRGICVREGVKEIRPTVSIGLASYHPGNDADTWLRRADSALYRAKQTGRNRVCDVDDLPVEPVVLPAAGTPAAGTRSAAADQDATAAE